MAGVMLPTTSASSSPSPSPRLPRVLSSRGRLAPGVVAAAVADMAVREVEPPRERRGDYAQNLHWNDDPTTFENQT